MHNRSQIRRHLLGLTGLTMLVTGAAGWFLQPEDAAAAFGQGVLLKVGIVLSLLWLAYPQVIRFPRWLGAGIFITGIALALRPQVVVGLVRASLWLLPFLPILWLLRPRPATGQRGRRPQDRPADVPRRRA